LKWAAASSGALTKITSASFSAQSSVTIDSCFTSTYTKYFVIWHCYGSVLNADLLIQFRYGGNTTQTTNYVSSGFFYDRNNTINGFGYSSSGIILDSNLQTEDGSFGIFYVDDVAGQGITKAKITGHAFGLHLQSIINYAGQQGTGRNYDGIVFSPTSGTITGSYAIYGVQN